jgi:N-acetylneuraminic acid mutarotase
MASRVATLGLLATLLGSTLLAAACADALRLEPPAGGTTQPTGGTTGGGTGGTVGGGGTGGAVTGGGGTGGAGVSCQSNTDCPEPTAVCDTVKGVCVECLVLSDCAFRPGTVCTKGVCGCPDQGTYCGPNDCVDTKTDPANCGACEHGCFGACKDGKCTDPWEPTSPKDAPAARSKHVAVWTGSKLVVWGGTTNGNPNGVVNSGGIYDPVSYQWAPTTLANAPGPRIEATVVWTGTEMIVWGGRDSAGSHLADGARFNPSTNVWTAVSATSAPSARTNHTAVWSGTVMIVWGGVDGANQLNTGGRYDPAKDTWEATAAVPSPPATRERHTAVWDDASDRMLLYGGYGDGPTQQNIYFPNDSVLGGRTYNPATNTWDALAEGSQPSARADHVAVWDGSRMHIFGGVDGTTPYLSTGFKYETNTWSAYNGTPPSARHRHTAVWLDKVQRIVVWGGRDANGVTDTGALLDPTSNQWVGSTSVVLSAREFHAAVSTGDKMIVWGGQTVSGVSNTGGIFTPP